MVFDRETESSRSKYIRRDLSESLQAPVRTDTEDNVVDEIYRTGRKELEADTANKKDPQPKVARNRQQILVRPCRTDMKLPSTKQSPVLQPKISIEARRPSEQTSIKLKAGATFSHTVRHIPLWLQSSTPYT